MRRLVVSVSSDYALGTQFDSGLRIGQGSLNFHFFGVYEMSTRVAWEIKIESPALALPPESEICYIAPEGSLLSMVHNGFLSSQFSFKLYESYGDSFHIAYTDKIR